jgi:hypothetical protein
MDDEVIVLTGNKSKAVTIMLGSAAFVVVGAISVANGGEMGWWAVGFFGLCFLVSLYMLTPNAVRLRIDKNGVEMKTFFKPMKLSWGDVNGFYVAHMRTGLSKTKFIGIAFSESYRKQRAGRQFASALTGMEGGLPDHFNRPAEEVCELLNESKRRWGGATDDGGGRP